MREKGFMYVNVCPVRIPSILKLTDSGRYQKNRNHAMGVVV